MRRGVLGLGKLPPPLLTRLLRWRGAPDRRVVVGPRCGVDAAVVALGRDRLILKADPVTLTTGRLGWYAVQVNANDIAVMGGRPTWFQPTILVPPGTRDHVVMTIARDIDAACRGLGVAVTGGTSIGSRCPRRQRRSAVTTGSTRSASSARARCSSR